MAQVVIPLLGLGIAYIISNSNDNQEGLENNSSGESDKENNQYLDAYQSNQNNQLTSTQPEFVSLTNNITYSNSDTNTVYQDKYFDSNQQENNLNSAYKIQNQEFVSLTGNTMLTNNVTHNNMTPFRSTKNTGASIDDHSLNETLFDNYLGTGTYNIEKKEHAPLFNPENNIQNVNGNQNVNDFMQSRVIPSQKISNVKPWEEQRVAPGLNQGYTTQGSNGFNSGMEARQEWKPKNVNELRTLNNQKETFCLNNHEGPLVNPVKEIGKMGNMEKRMPDTYYKNTPDRWFTTTGQEKANTVRSINLLPESNRQNTTVEYYGARGRDDGFGSSTNYLGRKYEESNKTTLPANPFINLTASGLSDPTDHDYGNKSIEMLNNNRSTTKNMILGNAYGANGVLNSVVNPIINTLKHTKKNNVVGNIRETGNVGVKTKAPTLYTVNQLPRTNREMIEHKLDCTHLNVQGQNDGGYISNKHQAISNQRETTNYENMGNVGGTTKVGLKTYDSAYEQRNNNNKTYENRAHMGGMSLFNSHTNFECNEREVENNRTNITNRAVIAPPSTEFMGQVSNNSQNYENRNNQNVDGTLLDAFKNNPYTQPLNSVA